MGLINLQPVSTNGHTARTGPVPDLLNTRRPEHQPWAHPPPAQAKLRPHRTRCAMTPNLTARRRCPAEAAGLDASAIALVQPRPAPPPVTRLACDRWPRGPAQGGDAGHGKPLHQSLTDRARLDAVLLVSFTAAPRLVARALSADKGWARVYGRRGMAPAFARGSGRGSASASPRLPL